jgi:hypothetical protein
MSTFLNLDFDRKIKTAFLGYHLMFCFLWILGVLLFVFRIDLWLKEKYFANNHFLNSLPLIAVFIVAVFMLLYSKTKEDSS